MAALLAAGPALAAGARARPKPKPKRLPAVLPGATLIPEGKDIFEWLEKGDDPKVQKWSDEQNKRTREALDNRPGRAKLRARLEELMAMGTLRELAYRPGKVFYLKREGLENQPKLYVRSAQGDSPHVLLDPNTFSSDGTAALDWWYPSQDGSLVAYGISEKGSEDSVLRVREVDSALDLPDRIPRTRHCSVAWLPDRSGFYYTRYPQLGSVPKGEEQYHRHVYFHKLGQDPPRDERVFGPGRAKEDWPGVQVSRDGRYLLVSVSQGWSKTEVYYRDLTEEATGFATIVAGVEATYEGEIIGDVLYVRTNEGAPRYKIVAAELKKSVRVFGSQLAAAPAKRKDWRTLVPEGPATLQGFDVAGGKLVVEALERATSRLRLYDLKGKALRELPVPALGTVSGFDGEPGAGEVFLLYQSFFTPPTLYRFDLKSAGALATVDAVSAPVDLSGFESEQVTYKSKDGTPVTMFLVHKKGMRKDRENPTLLSGYGGFNISMTPSFSPPLLAWLERGGLYALPNLRGGGEYGEAWHKAGMLGNKQNVFDDFIAAARWLIDAEYTRPGRLGISGGSNGGLLVGAAMTQAPELYRAAVASVPLMDMLRYDKFLLARLWIPEYGSADDPAQRAFLAAYSPYHRVRRATPYPAVLLMTAESDTRVDPMHARKMAAKLQRDSSSGLPVFLRLEAKAGHGAGKPTSKQVDELADRYSFLMWQLGME